MSLNLKPEKVFRFFEEMSQIPRTSGNEQAISDWLVTFGKERGLETIQDEALNVIIKKPGTRGFEDKEPVIIQGHMDMVGEKNADSDHDFEKDALKLRVKDNWLYATDTTLGADNGIAVAMGMAVLDSDDLAHPPIELLVTTNEEVGMDGAAGLDGSELKGTRLLNIDTETEGEFIISCAGGNVTKTEFSPVFRDTATDGYEIRIHGLVGGHSGLEIIKQRGNAVKLLGRALKEAGPLLLQEIAGGSKHNAIPREARAVFAAEDLDVEGLKAFVEETLGKEYAEDDVQCEIAPAPITRLMDEATSGRIIDYLVVMPDGVQSMVISMDNMVESSLNSGVMETKDDKVIITHAIRSSSRSRKKQLTVMVETLAELAGGEAEAYSDYPAWEYEPDSRLKDTCIRVYQESTGQQAKVSGIHAGLECGLLKEKLPHTEMISFGPDIEGAHTPEERLSIDSTERTWNFLVELLKNL